MIKFDFKTYVHNFIDLDKLEEILLKKDEYIARIQTSNMTGWTKEISSALINDIKTTALKIKSDFDCLVVIGIGGSYLGSYAFSKIFKSYFNDNDFEIIYVGTTLSSKYLDELYKYLEDKNFCLNIISKSGTTLETNITYKLLKDLLKRKYSEEELKKHIIITTDKENNKLRAEANQKNYKSFEIPSDIGGRYSFMTPAHLLPLAINYDIDKIIDGYYDGKRLIDKAFEYAIIRNLLFENHKFVENFCVYEENMLPFTEWLKQLFAETEGKKGVGILPISMLNTRDLHSLGQFIQEGNKIIFETFIKVANSNNFVKYNDTSLHTINNIITDSVISAHYQGNVPCLEIEISEITLENIASLIYFFQLSAAFSGLLFNVNPFNQPGVEVYKKEVKESLKKIGGIWKSKNLS